jgi:hypothetical protein
MHRTDLDLNSIERYWAQSKRLYRILIDEAKIQPNPWNNRAVVEHIMGEISPAKAKRFYRLFKDVTNAQPIKLASYEQPHAPIAGADANINMRGQEAADDEDNQVLI